MSKPTTSVKCCERSGGSGVTPARRKPRALAVPPAFARGMEDIRAGRVYSLYLRESSGGAAAVASCSRIQPGRLVVMPSTPAAASWWARAGSSTVQV